MADHLATIMKHKELAIGDKLVSYGSWSDLVVTIIKIDGERAISDNYYVFKRQFKDGDTYINKDIGVQMDYHFWEILD